MGNDDVLRSSFGLATAGWQRSQTLPATGVAVPSPDFCARLQPQGWVITTAGGVVVATITGIDESVSVIGAVGPSADDTSGSSDYFDDFSDDDDTTTTPSGVMFKNMSVQVKKNDEALALLVDSHDVARRLRMDKPVGLRELCRRLVMEAACAIVLDAQSASGLVWAGNRYGQDSWRVEPHLSATRAADLREVRYARPAATRYWADGDSHLLSR